MKKYFSQDLGEHVLLCDNGECPSNPEGLVIYRPKELETLKTLKRVTPHDKYPDAIRHLHALKKQLGANITGWRIPWGREPEDLEDQPSPPVGEPSVAATLWNEEHITALENSVEKTASKMRQGKSQKRFSTTSKTSKNKYNPLHYKS